MDPNRNYLQLSKKQKQNKKTERAGERKHNPQKAVVDEKAGMMRKQRRKRKQ